MKRILFTAAAAATVIAGSAVMAAPAFASTGPVTVTAVTHSANHPDTTSLKTGYPLPGQDATLQSPGGPVWAFDNTATKITATPISPIASDGANWSVVITETGQFQGFADPRTGAALTSTGSVKGTIQYDVSSDSQPDAANLPAQEPGVATQDQAGIDGGYTHLSGMISQLFGGHETVVGGGDVYSFSYQNGNYTQIASPALVISGDVRGH